MRQIRANLMLVLTAFIWGIAFVAQSAGMDYVGGFTFNAVRSVIGGVALLPCIWFLDRRFGTKAPQTAAEKRTLVLGGVACGSVLFVASAFQQIGIAYTTVGKAGFITALYILFVPLISFVLLRRHVGARVIVSVAIAVVGMYLLCINGAFVLGLGDTLIFLCAIGFACHILVIDHFSPKVDCVRMSCIQFFVCSGLSAVCALCFETPTITGISSAWLPLLYAGVLSSGVGYTLQIVAQKDTDPTIASLLCSLESVFALLAGWVLLHERLSTQELLGCALVFVAIVLCQLPEKQKEKAH